jgi:hypothetical protein
VKSRKGEDVWLFFVVDSSLAINCDTVTTGINTGEPEFTLNVNPNPVNTFLNITYRSQENLQCEIFDITGRMVTQFILYPYLKSRLFDASGLPQGMYIVKVKGATGTISERKFMKE